MTFPTNGKIISGWVLLCGLVVGGCALNVNSDTKYVAAITYVMGDQPGEIVSPLFDTKAKCEKAQADAIEQGNTYKSQGRFEFSASECTAVVFHKIR